METKLRNIAKYESAKKTTENGAIAYSTTYSNLLDLFGTIGALRNRSENDIIEKFEKAFNENPLLATKMMFYAGDIRGGLGERRTFKICLKYLAENYPEVVNKNLYLIPIFNRYDSLFVLLGTDCEFEMIQLVIEQLKVDKAKMLMGKPISLLAKWMPSENASSKKTRDMARTIIKLMDLTPKSYRKMLSSMREYLKITERQMSLGDWDKIEYSGVPSIAMMNYNKAFARHDIDRFAAYLNEVENGKQKINSSVLYPYNIVKKYFCSDYYYDVKPEDIVLENQWKSLPNYVTNDSNILVMADVSGSMYTGAICSSIGLAIYFAERNTGPLHNVYMTFTNNPHFQYIGDNWSLRDNIVKVCKTDMGYSTNLKKAFSYLLNIAKAGGLEQKDMPDSILVISDMEIDTYAHNSYLDFIADQKLAYDEAGYKMPKLILWNVEARNDTFLAKAEDALYVSGHSTSVFKNLLGVLDGMTSYDLMLKVLNDERYNCVAI